MGDQSALLALGEPRAEYAVVREQLFVPLRTTKAHGLGVGLYQVKTVVAAVGGRIRVESRPGGGSTFWVDLPAEVDGR